MEDRGTAVEMAPVQANRGLISTWTQQLRRLEWDVLVWMLFIKFALFVFVLAAVPALANRHTPWREMFNRWDALRYLELARDGYVATGEARFHLVGFPLYPWLVRGVSWLGFEIPVAGLVVTGVASLAVGWWLLRLVRLDYGEGVARLAVWFLFIFPTSYFLHVPYTEATLMAFTLGSFVAARKQNWALAGVLGGFAALSRMHGLLLLPAFGFEVWQQYRATKRIDPRWLWLAAIPCGFAVYLWLNYHVTGDPFAFSKLMHEHWFRELAWPWVGLRDVLGAWHREKPEEVIMIAAAEGFFTLLGLVLTIWSWFALRASYSVWMTGNILLSICSPFILAVPRYTLPMFPIFIFFALAAKKSPLWFAIITTWSLLLLALFSIKYALGHWAF